MTTFFADLNKTPITMMLPNKNVLVINTIIDKYNNQ